MKNDISYTIVVVDDEDVIRFTLQKKLARYGYNVITLEKAEDLLYLLKSGEEKIDLIITDVKLRKMDGIELLQRIRQMDEPIPVLIITGHGNVEDAIKALRYGASDFIRKPFDINEIASTVRSILKSKHEKKIFDDFAKFTEYNKVIYKIPVDSKLVNPISYKLTSDLISAGICNNTTAENIAQALNEAISNAMYHGNLEISSEIRDEGGIKEFNREIEARISSGKYSNRFVTIYYELTKDYVNFTVKDDGKGFNYKDLPDPKDPENFFKNSGRGLLIIRIHMDEVEWNEKGNQISMKKIRIERENTA